MFLPLHSSYVGRYRNGFLYVPNELAIVNSFSLYRYIVTTRMDGHTDSLLVILY